MYKILLSILLVTWVTLSYAFQPIDLFLQQGEKTFTVKLPDNQSTGYEWNLKNYDKSLLEFIQVEHQAPKTFRLGAPSEILYTFALKEAAVYPESTVLTFVYSRPWENKVEEVQKVTVHIPQKK